MFRYALFILLAIAGLLVQATVLSRISADALKPDLAFLVVVYLGLHRPMSEATPAVVVIGYLADRFTALPDGTFLLLYVCLFYLAAVTSKVLYFRGTRFPAVMVAALTFVYGIALTVMVRFGRVTGGGEGLLEAFRVSWGFLSLFAAANVVFSLALFRICKLIDNDGNLRSGQRASL
jgi:cell shape-determining protein MreD